MKKILLFLTAALCVEFTGCSKKDNNGDTDELPLKNEYTYNDTTKPINHAYYQIIERDPFGNKYRLLFASDEIESGDRYKDLEEFIYLEFVMGKHLNRIDYELKYSDDWPSLWMVEGRFADGFDFLGLSAEVGRISGGSFEFKILEEGVYRVVFNIKVSGISGGFRHITGEYGGTFTPYSLSSY